MGDPTDKDKDTERFKDQSTDTEGYLEYTNECGKGKVNQLVVRNKKDRHNYLKQKNQDVSYNVKRQQNTAGYKNRNK